VGTGASGPLSPLGEVLRRLLGWPYPFSTVGLQGTEGLWLLPQSRAPRKKRLLFLGWNAASLNARSVTMLPTQYAERLITVGGQGRELLWCETLQCM
jgi:hypothetical protein